MSAGIFAKEQVVNLLGFADCTVCFAQLCRCCRQIAPGDPASNGRGCVPGKLCVFLGGISYFRWWWCEHDLAVVTGTPGLEIRTS